jgi:hypothetical protein
MKTLTAATSGNGSQTGKERKVKEGGSALRAEDVPLSPSAVLFMSAVVRCRLQHHNFRKQQQTAAGSRTSSLTLLQEGPRLRSCFFFFCVLHNSFSFFFCCACFLKTTTCEQKALLGFSCHGEAAFGTKYTTGSFRRQCEGAVVRSVRYRL